MWCQDAENNILYVMQTHLVTVCGVTNILGDTLWSNRHPRILCVVARCRELYIVFNVDIFCDILYDTDTLGHGVWCQHSESNILNVIQTH